MADGGTGNAGNRPLRPFGGVCRFLVSAILVVAALLTSLSGSIASPRTAPDERHHYSYIKYVADHFGEFPIDYASMFTDRPTDPNHLKHPPLYYYLLAGVYLLVEPDRQFTEVGRECVPYGSRETSRVIIPVLRSASQFLAFVGLLGVYLLVRHFVRIGLLHAWLAVPATALMVLPPVSLYTGGSLNNDVMLLTLWPYITLYCSRYFLEGDRQAFWVSVFLLAAGVLSKATLWMFVLGFGLLLCGRLFWEVRGRWRAGRLQQLPAPTAPVPQLRDRAGLFAWRIAAIALCVVVIIHLGTNLARYGAVQPSYSRVHDIAKERSKFYQVPADGHIPPKSYTEMAELCATNILRSTNGILGHAERLYRHNNRQIAYLFGVSLLLVFASSFGFFLRARPVTSTASRAVPGPAPCPHRRDGGATGAKLLVGAYLVLVAVYFLYFVYRNHHAYHTINRYAAHGRYFFGYLQLLILSMFIMAGSRRRGGGRIRAALHWGPASVGLLGLFVVLFDPFCYTRRTVEFYLRSDMPTVIAERLEVEGFAKVEIDRSWPRKLLAKGYRKRPKNRLPSYHRLHWRGSTLAGEIDVSGVEGDVLEVLLWVRGDTAFGEDARLGVGICEVIEKGNRTSPDSAALRATVEADDTIETYRVCIPLTASDIGRRLVFVRLLNQAAVDEGSFLGRWWPRTRSPAVFGVYYRLTNERDEANVSRSSGVEGPRIQGSRLNDGIG